MSLIKVHPKAKPDFDYPVLDVDGKAFPFVFDVDQVRNVPNFQVRDDDVLICGFMRSGTHWMFEILNMLLRGSTDTIPDEKESLHIEHELAAGKIDTYPSPRVLSSHLFFEELPREVMKKKTPIVYLVRDPRDCLVSWYRLVTLFMKSQFTDWNLPFEDWLEMSNAGKLEWGNWFQNLHSWEKTLKKNSDHPIHLVFYEEIKKDTLGEIKRLNDFLDLGRNEDFCREVVKHTKLERMKESKKEYTAHFCGKMVHYNTGQIGSWRKDFTPSMSDQFNQLYKEQMEGSQFKDRYMY